MSTRIQALEHEVVEMRSGYSIISANTEVPAITGKDIMARNKGAEYWKETYFLTFKSNVIHYAIATAQKIRITLQFSESTSWNNLNPQQKEAATEAPEACVYDQYLLSACEGSWGARLLMVNAWGNTKESAS
ncbi:hypothetical protein BJV82DRAFT_662011 [Fennellomyces sp. T-0311]|nr:hypothetical protein BJV82DRAFT_662011 [Fennellomyces sp. T-0311]